MSQQQPTQDPVAEVCATSYRANDGDVHTMIEIRRLQNVKVGTLLYAFPPDAAARIAELEAYGRTRADEMLAATVRIAELEKQRDTLLAALRYLTEAILTNADADYMKRQMDEAVRVLDLHGVSVPVPYKAIASVKEKA